MNKNKNPIADKRVKNILMTITASILIFCGQRGHSYQINPLRINNPLDEIKKAPNNIKIELLRTWGKADEADEHKYFYEPMDIILDSEHNYFILAADVIRVFNKKTEFLRKMAGPGVGPGDLYRSNQIEMNRENDIVVWDAGNERIQYFSKNGQYKSGFKLADNPAGPFWINHNNELVVLNRSLTDKESPLWIICDGKGNIRQTRGIRKAGTLSYLTHVKYDLAFVSNKNDAAFGAYRFVPLIEKYDSNGKIEMEIRYEVPFEVPEITTFNREGKEYVDSEGVCQSIALDSKGNLFVLALTRIKRLPERLIGGRIATMGKNSVIQSTRTTPKLDGQSANLYQLLVLNPKGKVVSAIPINRYVNKIRIFNDELFLIDTYIDMIIAEYRIVY